MPRVLFLTNASCSAGRFGEGAVADLDEAIALDFERQGAVKVLDEAPAAVDTVVVATEVPLQVPIEVSTAPEHSLGVTLPVVDPAVVPVEPVAAPIVAEPVVENVQISASDGAHAQSHAG